MCKNTTEGSKDAFNQSLNSSFCKHLSKIALPVVFSFLLFITPKAIAENLPPGQDIGAQAERFKASSEKEKAQFEKKRAVVQELEIQELKEQQSAVQAITFTLKEVRITGVTVFKPEDFLWIYRDYLGKTVTFPDLDIIVGKIKARYKQKGYLTSTVYIPEQEIERGSVQIKVLEGKMGQLSIEGNKWFSSKMIEKYFHTQKNEILDVKKIQKDILRLNQQSDLTVKTIISAGQEPQSSDVTLKVADKFPWHQGVGFDNQGTRLSGKLRGSTYLRSTNVSGIGDSLYLYSLFSSLTLGESMSYSAPINTYGTKFRLDAAYFLMKIGKEFKPNDITGVTQIYTPHLSWELALSEFFTANANVGMDIKSIKKRAGETITSNDQLRIPFFGFSLDKIDSGGETSFSPKFNFGTSNFWGASSHNHPTASRENTGGFFFMYEQLLTRLQRMPFNSYLTMQSSFQAASHTLPSSEQFQLGGESSIRGYPEGDYLADFGGNLKLDWTLPPDWTFPSMIIPKHLILARTNTPLRSIIENFLFFDVGGGKLKKAASSERDSKFLMGIGGGIRVRAYNAIFLKLEWAKALGDDPASGSGPSTFYMTLQSEI